MCRVGLYRHGAQLVDDERFQFGKVQQLLVELLLAVRFNELRDPRGRAGEQDPVTGDDRRATQPDARVRFPDTGRTELQQGHHSR